MKKINSDIGLRFSSISNYSILRNKLIRELGRAEYEAVNRVLGSNLNLKKGYDRLTFYYLFKRLITFTKNYVSIETYVKKNVIINSDNFEKVLSNYFQLTEVKELAKILLKLVDETKSNNIKSGPHKKELNYLAYVNDHRCYICGSCVDYMDNNLETYRTIEHLKPRSLGGNKYIDNLYIACKSCNETKSNILIWLEKEVFSIHETYISHENELIECIDFDSILIDLYLEEKFARLITSEVIFIVTSMYQYKCSICRTDNDISKETYIMEKEVDDYFHILNLITICDLCLYEIEKDLSQNKYIKRKRITNV